MKILKKNHTSVRKIASIVVNLMATAPAWTPVALQVRYTGTENIRSKEGQQAKTT
jgi:hypothetical protein